MFLLLDFGLKRSRTSGSSARLPPNTDERRTVPQPPGDPSDLINNDPVPSGCNHRGTGTTTTPIDNGEVTTCNFCGTHLVVRQW